jgi:hypothetical protein
MVSYARPRMPSNLVIYISTRSGREENERLLPESEGKPWFLKSFSEVLTPYSYITDGKHVVGNETLHGTGSIVYGELRTIGFVG